jgi:hypothetical protein
MLAYADHEIRFRDLLQRANRANVSFYPLDARGLVVFDEPIGPRRPPPPSVDARRLNARQDALRTLAQQTDGYAILNTNAIDKALERMVQDTGAYYLLGYYSTNTRLDGRFRKLTVRVKRPGMEVRARPGYLAPTEAEMASARVDALMNGAAPGHSTMTPGVTRALERLAPSRGNVPVRVQAAAGVDRIWLTAEIDAVTASSADWQKGGHARVVFEHDRGAAGPIEADIDMAAGQRTFSVSPPPGALASGRYVVRVQLTPADGGIPLQATTDVMVPGVDALLSASGIASRRGPSTGVHYVPTADARFRRTERLRLEIPRISAGGTPAGRLLGRDGQALPLPVTISARTDEASQLQLIVADLTLAPLAQGEYVLEVVMEQEGKTESVNYGFRLVP